MKIVAKEAIFGHEVYSKTALAIYDTVVIRISNPFIWRCPSRFIQQHYNKFLSSEHLDVGVGTGYFLRKSKAAHNFSRLGLIDLNQNCLQKAAKLFKKVNPDCYQVNVLEPIHMTSQPYHSVGLNYLLHCLPGSLPEKMCAFDHLKSYCKPGGVIFGSTILAQGIQVTPLAKRLMSFYNQKGIFSNLNDSLNNLNEGLRQRFSEVNIQTKGCVAFFSIRV